MPAATGTLPSNTAQPPQIATPPMYMGLRLKR
jgi:hypothetical protein